MHSPDSEPFSRLVAWSRKHGGQLHDAVEIYRDGVTQVSLRVRPGQEAGLQKGDTAVFCPLATSLSYLNALADGQSLSAEADRLSPASPAHTALALPDSFLEQTPPHVAGRFFLMQQHLLGESSHWHPYLATLPQPDDRDAWVLPALWDPPPAGRPDLLAGTNAAVAAAEMREHVAQEFDQAQALLLVLGVASRHSYSQQLYHWAFCIYASRSFRPSLILDQDAQRALHSDTAAENRHHNIPRLPAGCQIDDFSILLPVLDLANHDPRAQVTWEPAAAATSALPGVSFHVDQPYAPGQQVFNNYGMKTNSELLLGYGFVLPPTQALHNDYVHLRKRGDTTASAVVGRASTGPPRDFLLSLRPMDHRSSCVGRSRQWRQPTPGDGANGILPPFSLFEDALLWDLSWQLWTDDDKKELGLENVAIDAVPVDQRAAILARVFAADIPDETNPLARVLDQARQALLYKVGTDYDRLEEADDDDDDDEKDNAQDRLDRAYREQYRAVLIHALTALDPELEIADAE